MRDPKTEEFKNQIGQGCKVKMDETGNILIKRFSKATVYVKNTIEENAVSNDILKLPNILHVKIRDRHNIETPISMSTEMNFGGYKDHAL